MIKKSVALIVAHPDDETLWAGGTIFSYPSWNCFIVCLCRKNDRERAQKFRNALEILNSDGIMGDLDDGPDQEPLDDEVIESEILNLLPSIHFDLIITHNPEGEYTRHRRHEETGKAVQSLWNNAKISANELWTFAYEDGNRMYYPIPVKSATIYRELTKNNWQRKYQLITETYGFEKDSWEAKTTPRAEAFWQITLTDEAQRRLNHIRNT
jgi:LmbE family N-acetylglucosaminyl deacetylase